MGYVVLIKNGIISMCFTDFVCPICERTHTEDDYYQKLRDSKNWYIYKRCKGCKRWLGITYDITGDIQVWAKDEEKK